MSAPPAEGARVAWDDVPAPVRAAIERECGDGVVVVNWPNACRGAAFVDLAFFAPSVAMQGRSGRGHPALAGLTVVTAPR